MRTISRLIATVALGVGLSAGVLAPAALAQSQQENSTQSAASCESAKESARYLLKALGRLTGSNDVQYLVSELQQIRDSTSNPQIKDLTEWELAKLKKEC
ncbi:hypothetical protein ACFQ68_21940 [Amycolatopsis japonica]|uniref:hypothetical protein n=1 Tax=Amycolatopsis japonica TaxID=208439 RepID=UPI00366A75D0